MKRSSSWPVIYNGDDIVLIFQLHTEVHDEYYHMKKGSYLVIDKHDRRPLIIDQPEENLDPKSVFDELVPHFREARRRRQVIIVTHNANLVVNTDADQVIVASSVPNPAGGLPTVTYRGGSIEDPTTRTAVCEILEGGEQAFRERERRYRLRRDKGHQSYLVT